MDTTLDRSTAPAPAPPSALKLPEIHSFALANGLQVRVVENHRLPVASVSLVFLAGAGSDAAGDEGAAQFAAQLLEEGTRSHTSDEIADTFESWGARVATWASWDASRISASALSATLPDVLPLFAEMVTEPAFPADEWERAREERRAEIQQEQLEPGSFAAILFSRMLARSHRFGVPQAGTEASLDRLSLETLRATHARVHQPSRACLAVVGDVRVADVRVLAESAFGQWNAVPGAGAPSDPPPPPRSGATQIHLVHRPGAVQSEVRLGHDAPPRSTADFYAMYVMNSVLGGCFNSRLMLNLREDKSYTYGASSRFDLRRTGGFFSAGAAVHTEVTAPAITEFLTEIRRMGEDGATDAELQYSRDYLAGVFPLTLETASDVANQVLVREIYDLPADYLHAYQAKVHAVSRDDAQRAAATYLRPGGLTILVLGDCETMGDAVRALGLPVTEYDETGTPRASS